MKNKLVALILVLIMALPLLSACQSNPAATVNPTIAATSANITSAAATTADATATAAVTEPAAGDSGIAPYGKYAKEVKVTMSLTSSSDWDKASTSGITLQKNLYSDYLKNTFNVVIDYVWSSPSDSYNQKVSLVIASGDVPDIMGVGKQEQIIQLQEAGMLADLTTSYETTAAPYIKAFYDSYGDRKFTTATFDGKLMAVPGLTPGYQHSFTWIRKDWLDKFGLSAPKTMDDLTNIAKTFIAKKAGGEGTIGFPLNNFVAGNYNSYANMDPLFASLGSSPRQWLKNAAGDYYYGTVAPETKTALAKVRDMYASGLIDQGFAARTSDDINAQLLSGKSGIFFGPWWMPDWPLGAAISNNAKADWQPYLAPLDSNGDFYALQQNPHASWSAVNAKCANPEVVWKLLNLSWSRGTIKELTDIRNITYKKENLGMPWQVVDMVQWSDAIPREYKVLQAAIDAKSSAGLAPEPLSFYTDMQKWLVDKDPTAWHTYGCRITGSGVASMPTKFVDNVYPATTPAMETKWANLQTMENQAMLEIIMGQKPIDYFDTFVQQWNNQGGKEIVAEVNAEMKAK